MSITPIPLAQFRFHDPFRSQIRPKHLRHEQASILLLVIFHDRNPGAAHGQAAAIKRTDEFVDALGKVMAAERAAAFS
jgi:hypothetical protein